jgi:hypothetical protein
MKYQIIKESEENIECLLETSNLDKAKDFFKWLFENEKENGIKLWIDEDYFEIGNTDYFLKKNKGY